MASFIKVLMCCCKRCKCSVGAMGSFVFLQLQCATQPVLHSIPAAGLQKKKSLLIQRVTITVTLQCPVWFLVL